MTYSMQNERSTLLVVDESLHAEVEAASRELSQPVAQTMKDAFTFSLATGRWPEPRACTCARRVLVWTPGWMHEQLSTALPRRRGGLVLPGNLSDTMRRALETVSRYRREAAPEVAEAIARYDGMGAGYAVELVRSWSGCSAEAADQFVARIRSFRTS